MCFLSSAGLLFGLLDVRLQSVRSDVLLVADLCLRATAALERDHEESDGIVRLVGYLSPEFCGPVPKPLRRLEDWTYSRR